MIDFKEKGGAIIFSVRVVPRASKPVLVGEHAGALKVRLAAPPVEGAANSELISFLARELGVPARRVEIVAGHASKSKRVRVEGVSADKIIRLAGAN